MDLQHREKTRETIPPPIRLRKASSPSSARGFLAAKPSVIYQYVGAKSDLQRRITQRAIPHGNLEPSRIL